MSTGCGWADGSCGQGRPYNRAVTGTSEVGAGC